MIKRETATSALLKEKWKKKILTPGQWVLLKDYGMCVFKGEGDFPDMLGGEHVYGFTTPYNVTYWLTLEETFKQVKRWRNLDMGGKHES